MSPDAEISGSKSVDSDPHIMVHFPLAPSQICYRRLTGGSPVMANGRIGSVRTSRPASFLDFHRDVIVNFLEL